jgi:hypothetical protein
VSGEKDALELEVDARRLSALRFSPVTTLVACHCSDIVLETAVQPFERVRVEGSARR